MENKIGANYIRIKEDLVLILLEIWHREQPIEHNGGYECTLYAFINRRTER